MPVDLYPFLLAAFVLALTPGPSVLYVTAFSLRFGTMSGMISVLGVNAGSFCMILIATFGLFPLLQLVPGIVEVIQTLGGFYMLYLAYKLWPRKASEVKIQPDNIVGGNRTIFIRGFVTTLLNPKDILFYILFIPTFIRVDEGDSSFVLWFLALSVTYALIGLATKSVIVVFAGSMKNVLSSKSSSVMSYVSSFILAGLGFFIFRKVLGNT